MSVFADEAGLFGDLNEEEFTSFDGEESPKAGKGPDSHGKANRLRRQKSRTVEINSLMSKVRGLSRQCQVCGTFARLWER